MELPAIDPSEAHIPLPMEDPTNERLPEEACFTTIAGGYEMRDSVLLNSSFPHVQGYEVAGASSEGGASKVAPAAAPPALPAKRKRGRPPKNPRGAAKQPAAKAKMREVEEEESVCFVCLDGGTLVVCDRRSCLKAYHPACVGRDEAFFSSKTRWNCGWHMCSVCGKAASFMCYTCPYSLCKGCIRGAEFFCIRGNKGLCGSCYRLVSLLEKNGQANGEKVEVNFNDESSWEYLFKIYWLVLKGKLSLTIKELDDARSLWKAPGISAQKEASSNELYKADDQDASSDSSTGRNKTKVSSRRSRKNLGKSAKKKGAMHSARKQEGDILPEEVWASQELLEFVARMRHGDKSLLAQFDVQNLLLEYIKQNNLRNPRRRSQILCDARLEKLFGKDRVGHFEMLKLLELHFVVKETSEVEAEYKQEGPLDNHTDLMDAEDLKSRELPNSTNKRHKNHKRVGERGLQNVNNCAAIDGTSAISVLSRAHYNDMIWHYQDPTGKIQGPFSMVHLRKWDSTGYFPPDLKIWLTSQKQEDGILLTDALSIIQKAIQQEEQSNNFPRVTNFSVSVVSTKNKFVPGCKENINLTSVEVRHSKICLNENPSDSTISASSHNVGDTDTWMNQSTDLDIKKEVLYACSRDTQNKSAKGNLETEAVSSINTANVRSSFTNKNQFLERSCLSPTPGSETQSLSSVQTNEVGCCQTMTRASEAYAVESQRDPAPPSVDIDCDMLNSSNSRHQAESDKLQFVLAQKAEHSSIPKILSPSQEQPAASVEENLLDGYEILEGISVINLEQHQNENSERSFLEPNHLDSPELEEWSLSSPTSASQPSSEWGLSLGLAQRGYQDNTLPPSILEAHTSQGRNASLEWETPVTRNTNANDNSGVAKQLIGSRKADSDRSGTSPGWGEQSQGSKSIGDSGRRALSQPSMNTSDWRALTLESKTDDANANSDRGADVHGNNNWGLPALDSEQMNCGSGNPKGKHAGKNSDRGTPAQLATTNANEEGWGKAPG